MSVNVWIGAKRSLIAKRRVELIVGGECNEKISEGRRPRFNVC
jgi:hypothetical protein